jgi:excisionase family DNA binding protein
MDFLTTQQAADKLGVHRSRIHALIQAGRLPAQKFGNVYMIKEADLKLVEERKTGRPPKAKAETSSKDDKKKGKKV